MAGYCDTSNLDPLASTSYGRPLRSFNKWQGLGVGFVVVGIGVMLPVIAASLHWLPVKSEDWLPMDTTFCGFGAVLVNSRREEISTEESSKRRRRALFRAAVGLAICAVGALILYFKGA